MTYRTPAHILDAGRAKANAAKKARAEATEQRVRDFIDQMLTDRQPLTNRQIAGRAGVHPNWFSNHVAIAQHPVMTRGQIRDELASAAFGEERGRAEVLADELTQVALDNKALSAALRECKAQQREILSPDAAVTRTLQERNDQLVADLNRRTIERDTALTELKHTRRDLDDVKQALRRSEQEVARLRNSQ